VLIIYNHLIITSLVSS